MTLRVAILIHDYYPLIGGAQALLRAQAPHLQAQGAEVTILTRRVPGTTAFEYVDGIPVHRLPVPPPRPLASMTFTLAALAFMLRRPPDVIHANEFISPATTALLARRFIHKPVVLTPHSCGPRGDIQNLQKRTSGQARLKAIREQADAFVVINDEISAELHSIGVLEEKLHFIKNGVDVSRFAPLPDRAAKSALRQRLGLPADATVVIFTGRLVVGKRVNYLLDIWPAIRAVQPKAELLILGDGDQRANLTKIAGEGVHFLGAQDDVTPYLQAADIFVLPSVQEGLSVALLEAMSCGLAPLTTTVGGNIEVICDGENGLLIPPDDLPALRSMLEKLVQDPGRCAAIGAAARNRVETSYSVVNSARQLFQLYLDLTKASFFLSRFDPMLAFFFWLFVFSIFYTYAGYPLLLGLLARSKPHERFYPPLEPELTLLIAAYNEEASIADKLENSLALEYPREKLQILVVADGSNDRTPAIVAGFANRGVELCYSPERRGKMAAINRGMAQARGEIVVFSDANNVYEPTTLRALIRPFGDETVGAVTGAKVILKGDGALGESEGAYWKYESWIKKQETRLGSTTGAAGEIFSLRRALFERPPDDIINDDFYMAMRIIKKGYRMVYAPEARSAERVSLTAQDEVVRRTRIIVGRYQAMGRFAEILPLNRPLVVWQILSHKFLRPLVPLAMIGAFLANLALVIWPPTARPWAFLRLAAPWNLLFLSLQVVFYLLAFLGSQVKTEGKLARLLYLPTFLFNSNLAALLGLIRYLTGYQTTLWTRVSRRT